MKTPNDNPPLAASAPSVPSKRSFGARLLLLAGSIGPLGHAPASGTVAVAVAGIPLCWLMRSFLSPPIYAVVTILFALAAMLLHHIGDRLLGEADSRKLVWDELVGFFIAMSVAPWTWPIVVIAFFAERIIDIVKVPPANIIDRRMHNGVGVVLDDVIAGLYTCGLLYGLVYVFPSLAG